MEGFLVPIKQLFRIHLSGSGVDDESEVSIVNLDSSPPKKWLKIAGAGLAAILIMLSAAFIREERTQFLPGTLVGQVAVGGLRPDEALLKMNSASLTPPEHTVELTAAENTIASSSAELEAEYEYQQTLTQVLEIQQAKTFRWLRQLLLNNQTEHIYPLPIFYNPEKLQFMIASFKQQVDAEPQPPHAVLGNSGVSQTLVINSGKTAYLLDAQQTFTALTEKLSQVSDETVAQDSSKFITAQAVLETLSQQLTEEQIEQARERAEKIIGEKLIFKKDHTQRILVDTQLIPLLAFPEGHQPQILGEILQEWAQELNREPQNADFVYDPETLAVSAFIPHRNGLELNMAAMEGTVFEGLKELEGTDTQNLTDAGLTKELALIETEPEKTLAETNDLGIKERIGFGESYYYHSIPNRIYNVGLTAQRINLTLVPPGKEFSFNQTLGDVSAATGFRPAYVIKDGQTMLGDGGGVCQVSSTLFRSLLDSGLNITRRLQHSYRVSYYELDSKPGFDATVYAGNVDLRFINDTQHYVLIYAQTNSDSLYMTVELYGTGDGRTTEIKDYQSWDPRPPLATQYIPDPTLAPGQLKQVDWSASGIKAKFTHIVRDKDSKTLYENEYYSNYRPWAAKYLQGI